MNKPGVVVGPMQDIVGEASALGILCRPSSGDWPASGVALSPEGAWFYLMPGHTLYHPDIQELRGDWEMLTWAKLEREGHKN